MNDFYATRVRAKWRRTNRLTAPTGVRDRSSHAQLRTARRRAPARDRPTRVSSSRSGGHGPRAALTRQIVLPTSSATSSAPVASMITPTGRPVRLAVGVEEAGQHVDRLDALAGKPLSPNGT